VGLGFGVGLHPVGHRWSRGSSSRGSPVCRGFEVGLGFWSRRGGGAVGLGFGVGSSSRGSSVCRGFEVDLGFWISARWWVVGLGLPWVLGEHSEEEEENKNEEREKRNEEREKKS
jgi:hypothetical protein